VPLLRGGFFRMGKFFSESCFQAFFYIHTIIVLLVPLLTNFIITLKQAFVAGMGFGQGFKQV